MGITVICRAVKVDVAKQDKFASREAALPFHLCFTSTVSCQSYQYNPNSWCINPVETVIPIYLIKIPNFSILLPLRAD